MFRDRDLFLLGAGAILSVFCLLLPLPFSGKLVLGVLTLLGFLLLALLRIGPDRIPPEEWLLRRLRFQDLTAPLRLPPSGLETAAPPCAGRGAGRCPRRGPPSERPIQPIRPGASRGKDLPAGERPAGRAGNVLRCLAGTGRGRRDRGCISMKDQPEKHPWRSRQTASGRSGVPGWHG